MVESFFSQTTTESGPGASYFAPGELITEETPKECLPPYLRELNEPQLKAAITTDGPLIVLAGAGSGKTRMLTSRIAYLMDHMNVSPGQILAVTFTNKAAKEMRERVQSSLNRRLGYMASPEIGTFHSVCIRILRAELQATPFNKPFVIFDDSDQLSLIKAVLKKLHIDPKKYNPKAFQSKINSAKCSALEPEEVEVSNSPFDRHFETVYREYQKELYQNNALDFGEIITMTYRVLRDHPDVRERLQNRFRYIHVDEYQDTNRAQYLFLSQLVQSRFGGQENICVVGDEDQSIYGWRGADIRNILDFEREYIDAKTVKLEQNYRSTSTIVQCASAVIQNNVTRKKKVLWTENDTGQKIQRIQIADERAEADFVVGEIGRLVSTGVEPSDCAIFYRTNAQSRVFEDALRRDRMDYQIVGGLRFYDRKEIKDILSYLRLILNPSDSISLKRVINAPARGIGKTTIDRLDEAYIRLNEEKGLDGWQSLEAVIHEPGLASLNRSAAKKLQVFFDLIQKLRKIQETRPLTELYYELLELTGYVQKLKSEGTEEAKSRIENLEEFDTLLQEFEEDYFDSIKESESVEDEKDHYSRLLPLFIEQSSLDTREETNGDLSRAVRLMTLHSSKGLEFPVVFVGGLEEGLFPSTKPWEETNEEEIEEERRLCYVGMTRARERLYLLTACVRRIWGTINYQDPSRFFNEMPDEYLEFHDLSVGRAAQGFRIGSSRSFYKSEPQGSKWNNEICQLDDHELVGRRLDHPNYGTGRIIHTEGSGESQKAIVEFERQVRKTFLFRYIKNFIE